MHEECRDQPGAYRSGICRIGTLSHGSWTYANHMASRRRPVPSQSINRDDAMKGNRVCPSRRATNSCSQNAEIETLPVEGAIGRPAGDGARRQDARAFACARGMLEFWIDAESPYAKPVFAEPKRFVFFYAGRWRSALAAKTAQDKGLENVAHIGGGFSAWKKACDPVEARTLES